MSETTYKLKEPDNSFSIGICKVYLSDGAVFGFEYQALKDLEKYPILIELLKFRFNDIEPIVEMIRKGHIGKYKKSSIVSLCEWAINNYKEEGITLKGGYSVKDSNNKTIEFGSYIPKGIEKPLREGFNMETIQQISNLNTTDLKQLRQDKPVSYGYLCLKNCLYNSGMGLLFVNQDKNRVYFKIHNKINGFTSYVMDLSYQDLLNMNVYTAEGIKQEVWNGGL